MSNRNLSVHWQFTAVIINSVNQGIAPSLADLQVMNGTDAALERQMLLDDITIVDGYCPETHARYEATKARKGRV